MAGRRAKGIMRLMRPAEWSKTFGNMVIGALLAAGFVGMDWGLFAAAFVAVGVFLWSGLYTLNDWVDWEHDKLHPVKKNRAIPSGVVKPNLALASALILLMLAFGTGIFVIQNWLFVFCLAAMLMNQFMYTLEPIMLKKKPVLDFISGSLVNPFFRFYAGWVLFMPAFNAPWEIVLFVLGIQFGGYALYRLSSKAHEAALNYKSSIVVFGEKNIKILAYLGIALGGGGFIFACLNGTLHFKFIWLAVLSLLAAPLYLGALRDPKAMDMKKIYRLIYAHYILFITGFIALGVFV